MDHYVGRNLLQRLKTFGAGSPGNLGTSQRCLAVLIASCRGCLHSVQTLLLSRSSLHTLLSHDLDSGVQYPPRIGSHKALNPPLLHFGICSRTLLGRPPHSLNRKSSN